MNNNKLLHENVSKLFLQYLLPSIGGMLGVSLYVLGDTMLVGRGLGSPGLAALNISIPMINVLNGLGLLFGIGGATTLSIDRGQQKYDAVNDIFTKAMGFSFFVGLLFFIIRLLFLDQLCYFLGASEATFAMTKDYLGVFLSFSIPFLLNSTLTVFVRNDGAPRLAMWGMLAGSIANVILDYIFIFIFKWGMAGGALATGIAPLIGLAILSTHFLRKNNQIKFIFPEIKWSYIKRILANGSASFILELSGGIVIFAFNIVLLGIAGDIGVSAYSIIANLSLICAAIFTGIGQAIQPIVSFNFGAGRLERVYETFKWAFILAIGLGGVFYLSGLFFPEILVNIFTNDTDKLMGITVRGIRLYFLGFLGMGINIVMASYIQSKEDTNVSMIISFLRGFVLIIAGLLILPKLFGIDGVWLTVPVVEFVTLNLSFFIFSICRRAMKHLSF